MRRVLIVSTAILVLFATSAVMAGEQQVSDRLLEILKERQIISENEFAELSDIADQMKDDQTQVDNRLEALDASISEYLAKEGDEAGVAMKHKKGTGFGFTSGNFELWIGGLFQFEYYGVDRKNAQDTNNFRVKEARFYFKGKAFVEGFTYKFQWQGNGGVALLDAYGNYVVTEGVEVRFGQFKTPYSRQQLTSTGKLEFMDRSIVVNFFSPGRDIGVMAHDVVHFGENPDDMALEWAFGLFNGDGTNVSGNDNNWLGWCARIGFYPMGYVGYAESNFAGGEDVKFGVAGSYYSVRNRPFGTTVKNDLWEIDAVVTWAGLYATGEYHNGTVNPDGSSSLDFSGWFLQAGYLFMDNTMEAFGRYSYIDMDKDTGLKEVTEWAIGIAWYPEGYGHPFKVVLKFSEIESDEESSSGSGGFTEFDIDDVEEFYTYLERSRFVTLGFQLDW
jgi:hypothetical protein